MLLKHFEVVTFQWCRRQWENCLTHLYSAHKKKRKKVGKCWKSISHFLV